MSAGGTADRWGLVEALFRDALDVAASERDRFIETACAGDPALRRELCALLAAHDHPGPFDRLAADVAPLASRLRTPASPSVPQESIGHYRIVGPVAGGGMGVVYQAVDERLGRTVALKFLHAHLGTDDSAAGRFRHEARAVASLEHPNVCTVYEIGEAADGRLYFAMPLYEGETLQQRIAHGPLAVASAVGIAIQIARGLATAHERGIVHRDIKPSNVFVTRDGVVKILDFGIAKLADVTLTDPGAGPLGTVAYMSPEQVRGTGADHRTDLWALGVVLYEMLTGVRPFDGGEPLAVRAAILEHVPAAPSTQGEGIPAELDRIVARALAKSAEARYGSARALERDLLALGVATEVSGGGAPAAQGGPASRRRAPSSRRRTVGTAGAAVLTLVAAAALWAGLGRGRQPGAFPPATPEPSIAVLPFVNMTPDASNEYFSDGMTEEVITHLAALPGLKVISRTSAMHYKGSRTPLRQIASELRVANVLEGSVRREGDKVRITAQLIDAATDEHLWSQRYDRRVVDVVAVQEDIAREVARSLAVRLGDRGWAGASRGTRVPEAYELYLRGRYQWNKRTKDGHEQAIATFRRAIELDSTYADAYAGLSTAYLTGYAQYIPGFADREAESYANLKWAAERAVALDDNSALAHRALSLLRWWQRDWPAAERELLRTLELNPGDAQARNWYAALLGLTGRIDEAVREGRRAFEMDPFSLTGSGNYVDALLLARQYDLAIEQTRRTLEIDPTYLFAHRILGILYALTGRHAEAERELRGVADAAPHIPDFRADLAYALARAGRPAEARRILRAVEALPDGPRKRDAAFSIGRAHVALGEPDSAFAWLERADWRWPHRGVRFDPALDPVRSDPRFVLLSQRVDREMGIR